MSKRVLLLFIVLLSITANAQVLKGKIYDSQTTIKGAKILNKTQNIVTGSDDQGNFSIKASVNDTISIESLFHHNQNFVVKQKHFDQSLVIELKKDIQQLDEVVLTNEPKQPAFKGETYNSELQQIIKDDIKRNPHLYSSGNGLKGPDLFAIIGMVSKLFKKKRKTPVIKPISYNQIDSLVAKNSLINKSFLLNDLSIPENYLPLFYEFCEAKQMSGNLLKKSREMYLLEAMIQNSEEFLKIIDDFKKEQIVKD
ncbi:carboxypeptidase-like regulatory domain-containing protein [Winogradskyella sp. 3972H.M.0a.05]|uniref:carboxypeptidase-like regulatory domain-containing protein n=1 Tax=Winogradskyella sp. 3972H.M.0a.05 TaxID=2950277 RepID=UPI0033994DED